MATQAQTLTGPEVAWHISPAAIALFDKAWAICGHDDSAEFPYDIEADLNDFCNRAYDDGGECPISAWDKYCAERAADNAEHFYELRRDMALAGVECGA